MRANAMRKKRQSTKPHTRGAVRKSDSTLIGAYFPNQDVPQIRAAVIATDSDMSKFLRAAVREKLERTLV